jgi:hypothetical protein
LPCFGRVIPQESIGVKIKEKLTNKNKEFKYYGKTFAV